MTLLLRILLALITLLLAPVMVRAELVAKNLLLVVNRNAPEGVELATHYARVRGVPPAQIVQLDLPTGDEISIDDYERLLADPLRGVLRSASFAGDVKCIVTFLGIPFRIPPRTKEGTAAFGTELKLIEAHTADLSHRAVSIASEAERLARKLDPTYATNEQDPVLRLRRAASEAQKRIGELADPSAQREHEQAWASLLTSLQQPLTHQEPAAAAVSSTQRAEIVDAMRGGGLRMFEPAARQLLRADGRRAGLMAYLQILGAQRDYLGNDQTDAAVDSELACLKWNMYRRTRWQGNPLRFNANDSAAAPATLMVMRLDGPGGAKLLKQRIDEGIAREESGLRGNIVLDSRNIPLKKADGQIDGYGIYDESIRKLNEILAASACKLPVIFDASDKLIADDSLTDIAVYCGWYNPDRVHLPGKFVQGSVGFHVASYTAVSIRGIGGGLWTATMIDAGVVSTLGAVSEPYLSAFPAADEYVPMLLTGKLTMAEVYWRTAPMTSWKIVVIGDPLYNPFRAAPAIEPDSLPPAFSKALSAN